MIRRRCSPPPCPSLRFFFTQHLQEYIQTRPQNPFVIASWLHLLLTQCHPFDVSDPLHFPDGFPLTPTSQRGDGRIINMIASVPLILTGYPMINIDLDQRTEYYEGIRRVSNWMACGSILLTMSRLGARGRSRAVGKMFCRWHAKNPRVHSRALVGNIRHTYQNRFPAEPLKPRPRAPRPSPHLLLNPSPVLLANGAARRSTWPKKTCVAFIARTSPNQLRLLLLSRPIAELANVYI